MFQYSLNKAAGKLETIQCISYGKEQKKNRCCRFNKPAHSRITITKSPIFQSLLHPELPIIITGFGTGHIAVPSL
nr:BPK_HP1_G0058320.mRNA.1.CDS.1 [Saccharomyces cerevisiae]